MKGSQPAGAWERKSGDVRAVYVAVLLWCTPVAREIVALKTVRVGVIVKVKLQLRLYACSTATSSRPHHDALASRVLPLVRWRLHAEGAASRQPCRYHCFDNCHIMSLLWIQFR